MTEIFNDSSQRQLSQLFYAVLFFHASEYLLAIACHGKSKVTIASLLISKDYLLAMILSMLEYLLELHFFPNLKTNWSISNIGFTLVILGETIRKLAILTAGRAFTHFIQQYHEDHHKLITYGIYGVIRHPGYSGVSKAYQTRKKYTKRNEIKTISKFEFVFVSCSCCKK
ncbi:hypothetical protein LXL04_000607 [Taraxacum kok-saghyz]